MPMRFNPFTGNLDWYKVGGSGPVMATQAPKLIATFNTDVGTLVNDLVVVNGDNSVTKITSNTAAEIPHGIFGVVTSKPSGTSAEVIFVGIQGGYSGFTTSNALFVGTDGLLTHSAPATGTVQQIGFAVSTTEIFVNPKQPIRRAS